MQRVIDYLNQFVVINLNEMIMSSNDSIQNNSTDLIALVAKSAVGAIPYAGPLLSEIVGTIIPNQRIDRLGRYVQVLDDRISAIPSEVIQNLVSNDDFIDLIEEGFVQASRAISAERRCYIASIIFYGITDEQIRLHESKYLLKILEELNDIEVIWLRYYSDPMMNSDTAFREKHKNILTPIIACAGADKGLVNKSSIQKSYKEHLERMQLIESKIKVERKTNIPEFDRRTGKPKISYTIITHLGKLLLEQIGIDSDGANSK